MPKWIATKEWEGQDVFIVGGGSSLRGFDYTLLKGKNVIGCNHAFRLGEEVVSLCLFGDAGFFQKFKWDMEKLYKGRIVTCAPSLANLQLDWLHQIDRVREGLGSPAVVGWNFSTGAAAISLAYHMGAKRIFLLGFDMAPDQTGETHWHNHRARLTNLSTFSRHLKGLQTLACALEEIPASPSVINVTDGGSAVGCFPRINFQELKELVCKSSNG